MAEWKVEYSAQARRTLQKLDRTVRERIEAFIERLSERPDPRTTGKLLTGNYAGHWRYRVGQYRIICAIHDNVLTIEVVQIGHRSDVYKR